MIPFVALLCGQAVFGEPEWWFFRSPANPIDGVEHLWLPDNSQCKLPFSREIHQGNTDENCNDTLTRKKQHEQTCQDEYCSCNILEKEIGKTRERTFYIVIPAIGTSSNEIIFRDS